MDFHVKLNAYFFSVHTSCVSCETSLHSHHLLTQNYSTAPSQKSILQHLSLKHLIQISSLTSAIHFSPPPLLVSSSVLLYNLTSLSSTIQSTWPLTRLLPLLILIGAACVCPFRKIRISCFGTVNGTRFE